MEKLFINGKFVESSGEERTDVFNPATGEFIASVPAGTKEDVEKAIKGAEKAQKSWAKKPATERAEIVRKLGLLIREHRQELAELLTNEQGKPLAESLTEVDKAIAYCDFMAARALQATGETINSERPNETILIVKKPVGIVAGIVPWNFPIFVFARKVIPALVSGCAIIVKPSSQTPLTAFKLAELIQEAGVDAGIFQIVTGSGSSVGNQLSEHPKVRLVTFTGSTAAGKKVMEAASGTVKKVNLELGGKAPAIVSKHADIEVAAEKIVQSRVVNAGQACTCAERVYVQEEVADHFIERVAEKMSVLNVGDPLSENTDMGPINSKQQLDSIIESVETAKKEGAKVILGGKRIDKGKGFFFEPTVITNAAHGMDIMTSEIFGPVLPITTFKTLDEAFESANDSEYGLSSSFYSQDYNETMRAINEISFGEVFVNRENEEAIQGFHAGMRQSGIGGADGEYGYEEFLVTTVAYMEYKQDVN